MNSKSRVLYRLQRVERENVTYKRNPERVKRSTHGDRTSESL